MKIIINVIKKKSKECLCYLMGMSSLLLLFNLNVFASEEALFLANTDLIAPLLNCIREVDGCNESEESLRLAMITVDNFSEAEDKINVALFEALLTPDKTPKLYKIVVEKLADFIFSSSESLGPPLNRQFVDKFLNYYSEGSDRYEDLLEEDKEFIKMLIRAKESRKS